jgi:hypothetical protein
MYVPPPQYNPPPPGPYPYPSGGPPPPRGGTSPLVIVLIVLAAVFLLGLGTCAGLFFLVKRMPAPVVVASAVSPVTAPTTSGAGSGGSFTATTIDRPGYSMSYPSNWTVDTADKDYDPDAYFAIDESEGCTIMFFFFDVKGEPEKHVQAQVDAQTKRVMPNPSLAPFTTWGRYQGKGTTMTGRMKPLGQGTIRIFSHAGKSKTFDAVEFCFDDDLPDAKPGFEMIESSFKLKKE